MSLAGPAPRPPSFLAICSLSLMTCNDLNVPPCVLQTHSSVSSQGASCLPRCIYSCVDRFQSEQQSQSSDTLELPSAHPPPPPLLLSNELRNLCSNSCLPRVFCCCMNCGMERGKRMDPGTNTAEKRCPAQKTEFSPGMAVYKAATATGRLSTSSDEIQIASYLA